MVQMVEIVAIDTPTLGDRSYLVTDGEVALVVDPQRDIDRVLVLAGERDVRITHVFETHLHNDYVTGGLALARATGGAYHVNAADRVAFERVPVRDGETVRVGPAIRIRAVSTPGHTFHHLAYLMDSDDRPPAVFSGGSLLFGTTGRPDLLGPAHTEELAHAQFASARWLAAQLPDQAELWPTHGFGSFCAAHAVPVDRSTIGREKQVNPVLTRSERDYVATVLAGLDAYPAYYARMAPANAAGPAGPDLSPPHAVDADELLRRLTGGEWVVDLRSRTVFAAGHVAGTLNFGLDGEFATYLGWMIPWGTPLTLLGASPGQVAAAQRELVRIGIDRPAGAATGTPRDWAAGRPLGSFLVAHLADLADVVSHRPVVVLDVRHNLEWARQHIEGAVHIPLPELPGRLAELPPGEVWVHCGSGYRAAVAASLLDAAGRRVVAIDDEFDKADAAGLPLAAG
jgi:hydroxyacylglutathione hydrolase